MKTRTILKTCLCTALLTPCTKAASSDLLERTLAAIESRTAHPRAMWTILADRLALMESNRQNVEQLLDNGGRGPGSGYWQFEAPSLDTARNRLKNLLGSHDLTPDVRRASQYDLNTQKALLFANLAQSPHTKLSDGINLGVGSYTNGPTAFDVWSKAHKIKGVTQKHYDRWVADSQKLGVVDYPQTFKH
jgi:hypothetical protein